MLRTLLLGAVLVAVDAVPVQAKSIDESLVAVKKVLEKGAITDVMIEKCTSCKTGGAHDGGVPIGVQGCEYYCSGWGYCGSTPNYLAANGVDCSFLKQSTSDAQKCAQCRTGGSHDGGVPIGPNGCEHYCSGYGYCGSTPNYLAADGIDCANLGSTASGSSHKIVDGHPTKDGQRCAALDALGQTVLADEGNDNTYCAADDNTRVAGVRCCRDDNAGILDRATAICDGKCERVTYEEAEARCAAKSASSKGGTWRLCTENELMTGEDQFFKGCQYDYMYVWASDTCATPDTPPEFSPPAAPEEPVAPVAPPSCPRPAGWCTHPGSTYQEKDCDGDGTPDPYCTDSAGNSGILSSAQSCHGGGGKDWPTGASATCPGKRNQLVKGETLKAGNSFTDKIESPNGQYYAVLQTDGNFVLYTASRQAIWASHAYGATRLNFQTDGNVVAYNAQNGAVWATGNDHSRCCHGRGDRLVVQDDGNLVLYNGNQVAWAVR